MLNNVVTQPVGEGQKGQLEVEYPKASLGNTDTATQPSTQPGGLLAPTQPAASGEAVAASPCCGAQKQQSCCAPSAKASCCGAPAPAGSCGCQ